VETSRRKAITAASTRKPSAAIPEANITLLEHGTGGLLTGIKGGVPLVFDGVHTGGLGIAGGSPEQDAEIAAATLAELGTDKAEA
jgi:glc operon protein GlcG